MVEITTVPPPNGRGCGKARSEGDPYACCGLSASGMPIEFFIIDPVAPWRGGWQRGAKILPVASGLHHLFIFVGKEFYPSPWDFVEEARRFGASRKMPKNLPFHLLTPGQSMMVFIHARAIPNFAFELQPGINPLYMCKWREAEPKNPDPDFDPWAGTSRGYHPAVGSCTMALKDLTALMRPTIPMIGADQQPVEGWVTVEMPSFTYNIQPPVEPLTDARGWSLGAFLALPLTHFEFPKSADPVVEAALNAAGYEAPVLEW